MTELKTLKDIEKDILHEQKWYSNFIIYKRSVKQEAIKWIKHYRSSEGLWKDKSMIIDWIAGFFNITEKDLK